MDASTLQVAETTTMHVKNAAGEPQYEGDKPVQIVFHSPGTRAYAAVESRQTARTLKRMNDNDGKLTAATAEEARRDQAEDLAALTIRFENLTYGDKSGEELHFALFNDQKLGFIATQAQKHLKDWGNSKAGSAAS